MDTIGTVFRIMFFSTIGTAGILIPIIAIPVGLALLIKHIFRATED